MKTIGQTSVQVIQICEVIKLGVHYADFREDGEGLNIPLRDLPLIKKQKRKTPRKGSIHPDRICGADTETIDGTIHLFSTEFGVWEINSFSDLVEVLYNENHGRAWRNGNNSKNGKKARSGYTTKEFFFWNLKYDCQAVLKLFSNTQIETLLEGDKLKVPIEVHGEEIVFELKYIEGKYFEINPKDWRINGDKVGVCYWWDICQFFNKMRLDSAGKKYLNQGKMETCFDGTILDIAGINNTEYREKYIEDIKKYAVIDAQLAGDLTRHKLKEYTQANVRFIRPYSLANVAQRNLLDSYVVPTINEYLDRDIGKEVLQMGLSSYAGGWFETTGQGFQNDVLAYDLASAYPYVMYHLPDCSSGDWVIGNNQEEFLRRLKEAPRYSLIHAEVYAVFEEGLSWYPLCKKSPTGTLTAPRIIEGWFTGEEILEAMKWPIETLIIGEWAIFKPDTEYKPFQGFINKFYEMKMTSDKSSAEYSCSKVILNSIYGKFIQATKKKGVHNAGKLWNPNYAAIITGGTRARLAEFNRLNGSNCLSYATDGVILPRAEIVMPEKPLDACFNLGDWEEDGEGDLIVIMSGVYSMRMKDKVKTVFRGSASYFLRPYRDEGIFGFCEENSNLNHLSVKVMKPYSAKEARVRSDYALINVFEERSYSMKLSGDVSKRLGNANPPRVFGELLLNWYPSRPLNYFLELVDLKSESER